MELLVVYLGVIFYKYTIYRGVVHIMYVYVFFIC